MNAIGSAASAASKDKTVFNGLDALRGYAAIAVLLFHSSELLGTPWLAPSGFLAVDLFFAMSGFVIAHSYERRIPEKGALWFAKVRLIRFLPLYVLGGILGLARVGALLLAGSDVRGAPLAVVSYFLLLPAPDSPFSGGAISPLNPPAWSLLFEIYTNLLFALALPILSNRVVCAAIIACGATLIWSAVAGYGLTATPDTIIGFELIRTVFSLGLGIMIYRWRRHLPGWRLPSWMLPIIVVIAFSIPGGATWNILFIMVASPMILIVGVAASDRNWMAWYGATASFAIYAVHAPILMLASGASTRLGFSSALAGACVVCLCLAVGPGLDRFFDRPIRRALKRRAAI